MNPQHLYGQLKPNKSTTRLQNENRTSKYSPPLLPSRVHDYLWQHCWLVVTSIPISPLNICSPQNKSPGRMKQYFLGLPELLGAGQHLVISLIKTKCMNNLESNEIRHIQCFYRLFKWYIQNFRHFGAIRPDHCLTHLKGNHLWVTNSNSLTVEKGVEFPKNLTIPGRILWKIVIHLHIWAQFRPPMKPNSGPGCWLNICIIYVGIV